MEREAREFSGLYGYRKATQKACESGIKKLSKAAISLAKSATKDDAHVASFLRTHAKRSGSKSAQVIAMALDALEITPSGESREASGMSLYGYNPKTARAGLGVCAEIRIAAGEISNEIFSKKADLQEQLAGFLKTHSKKAKCKYSALLAASCPDFSRPKSASLISIRDFERLLTASETKYKVYLFSDEGEELWSKSFSAKDDKDADSKAHKLVVPVVKKHDNAEDWVVEKMASDVSARFERGKPADPTERMDPEDAAKWEAWNTYYTEKFEEEGEIGGDTETKGGFPAGREARYWG